MPAEDSAGSFSAVASWVSLSELPEQRGCVGAHTGTFRPSALKSGPCRPCAGGSPRSADGLQRVGLVSCALACCASSQCVSVPLSESGCDAVDRALPDSRLATMPRRRAAWERLAFGGVSRRNRWRLRVPAALTTPERQGVVPVNEQQAAARWALPGPGLELGHGVQGQALAAAVLSIEHGVDLHHIYQRP